MGTTTDTKSTVMLLHRANNQLQHSVFVWSPTLAVYFQPTRNRSSSFNDMTAVHCCLEHVSSFLSPFPLLETHQPPLTMLSMFGLYEHSLSIEECQWVPFLPPEGFQRCIFAFLICQTPFCQAALLLPPVTRQHQGTGY